MDQLALAIGVLAGLVQLAGYWQYNKIMSQDPAHKPNAATWFMWGAGGVEELIVYAALVQDRSKEILPAVCAVVVTITFLRVWWREGTLSLDRKDWLVIGVDVFVIAFWFVTHDPVASNVLLGMDISISFIPIIKSTLAHPNGERPQPWRTWTSAYALLTLVVVLQWENGWELVYPVVCLVLHCIVWQLARAGRRSAVA